MAILETALGDALFNITINFQNAWPTRTWQDTTHFHIDSELHVILDGNAVIEIGGKDVHINTGEICLLAPRSSHYPKTCSKDLETTNFSFRLTQNSNCIRNGKTFSEYVYYSNIFKSVSSYFIINDAGLLSIVQKLVAEQFSSENEHFYQALLAVFFLTLAKHIKEHHLPYKEQTLRIASGSENSFKQIKIVEEFFQKRYNEEVSIEDLAKELCLSVPHTHRIVKKVFDEGFKKTLIKQRIEHACMLIKQHDLPLPEIAYRCGYTSYNGFLTAFKNYTGKTPKEYKKSIC
jgi:AraC-like DNA-binding protein